MAVFGLGGIGLAVVQGARQQKRGAFAIDTNPSKFELANSSAPQTALIPMIMTNLFSRCWSK
ncbi:hypothetical protein WHW08_28355 [Klebsiella pneumoniae]